jgi:hypothetical protein
MDKQLGTCPLTQQQLLDEYFMEHRNHLLEIAAFLDRLDRSVERNAEEDFRIVAFREALQELSSASSKRVERIQLILSDPVTELMAQRDRQNAFGAPQRDRQEVQR